MEEDLIQDLIFQLNFEGRVQIFIYEGRLMIKKVFQVEKIIDLRILWKELMFLNGLSMSFMEGIYGFLNILLMLRLYCVWQVVRSF